MAKDKHPEAFRQESCSPHSFRHSIAVHKLEDGDSLFAIKAFPGHENIETTSVYAEVTPELANKFLRERNGRLEKVLGKNGSLPGGRPGSASPLGSARKSKMQRDLRSLKLSAAYPWLAKQCHPIGAMMLHWAAKQLPTNGINT
jgi:hypothetical protein